MGDGTKPGPHGSRVTAREALLLLLPLVVVGVAVVPNDQYVGWSPNLFYWSAESNRRASCATNLRVTYVAIASYAQDSDDHYPWNAGAGWATQLWPYTKTYSYLWCQSDPAVRAISFSTAAKTCYWMNARIFDSVGKGLRTSDLSHPAHTFLLGDGDGAVGFSNYTLDETTWQAAAPYARRHLGGANYAWADGHVAWARPETVAAGLDKGPGQTAYSWRVR